MYDFVDPFLPPRSSTRQGDSASAPFVTLTYATSLDSSISLGPERPTQLSGPESKRLTHHLRSRHDAILVGVGTAMADDPGLNCRLHDIDDVHRQPRPIVIDPHGRWPVHQASRVVRTAREGRGKGVWVICAEGLEYPSERRAAVEEGGGQILSLPMRGLRMDWSIIFMALARRDVRSVMVEGGADVINQLLAPANGRLLDSVIITIAPVFLGQGGVRVSPLRRIGEDGSPAPAARLQEVVWRALGEDVIICGRWTEG